MNPNPEPLADSADRIDVSAVMPCLNEESSLGICIEKAQRCFRDLGIRGEVVVADNGSTDRSTEIAEGLGARVVREPTKGYGAALTAGILAARGEIIVMADADDSYDWLSLGQFVDKVKDGCDVVIGNRFRGGIAPGAMPPLHRYFGNPVLSAIARLLYRIPIGDFHCGMRAVRKSAFLRANPRTRGMEFATEMIVSAAQAGLRISEIPTTLSKDKRDRKPHLRSFRDGWRHLRFMLTYAPDYLYIIPGGLLGLVGLVGLIALSTGPAIVAGFTLGIHFLALASLLFLAGTSIVALGLLAKAFYANRYPIPQSFFATFLARFTLERGIVAGLLVIVVGLVGDGMILARWMARDGGSMPDTVHTAFVASTAIVAGIQIIFNSFLLNMLRDSHQTPQ